jgi:hypothetical protein
MADWKKVVVSGSLISALNNDANYAENLVDGSNLSGSFSGSFEGDGSGLTGVVASAAFSLTDGAGITDFTYDGSAGATVVVSGSTTLTSDKVTKWSGDAFVNSNITDTAVLTTFAENAVFAKDITVQGTASFQNTQNLLVADRFVLFASGSTTVGDGGIVVQQATNGIGKLYGYDSTVNRWGFTSSFATDDSAFTPDAFVGVVQTGTGQTAASAAPIYGGASGHGTIHIDTDDSEIWIFA